MGYDPKMKLGWRIQTLEVKKVLVKNIVDFTSLVQSICLDQLVIFLWKSSIDGLILGDKCFGPI